VATTNQAFSIIESQDPLGSMMRASVQPILPLYRPQDIPRETDAHFRKYQTVAGADRQVMVRSVGFGRGCEL